MLRKRWINSRCWKCGIVRVDGTTVHMLQAKSHYEWQNRAVNEGLAVVNLRSCTSGGFLEERNVHRSPPKNVPIGNTNPGAQNKALINQKLITDTKPPNTDTRVSLFSFQ